MSLASIILGVVLSTLLGAIFHLIPGGGIGRLGFYLCLSWVGFILGHLAAASLHIQFDRIGELHAGIATLGSILSIGIGYWLSLVKDDKTETKE